MSQMIDIAGELGTAIGGALAAGPEIERKKRLDDLILAKHKQQLAEQERGLAKERFTFDQGEAQQAIRQGDYSAGHGIMRRAQADRNTYLGRSDVGPKLIGTPTGNTIERQRPAPDFQGPMPGVPEVDATRPDFANPANRLTIERSAGYTPPKIEWKSGNAGDRLIPLDSTTGRPMSGVDPINVPAKPAADPKPRYVRRDNGDGTFSMVEMVPGQAIPYKPAKTKYVDEKAVWDTVDKRLAGSKPVPNQDHSLDIRSGKPLGDALKEFEQRRQQDFEEEYRLQVEQNPSTGANGGRSNPFGSPGGGGGSFNQPSRGMYRPRAGGGTAHWAPIIKQASEQYGVPAEIIQAVMRQESGGNPNARSPVGALGLMQFMPGTARGLGIDPLDPNQAILGGAKHLAGLYAKFGRWSDAIAAYNAGADDTPASKGKRIGPFAQSQSDPRYRVWENPANAGYAETRNYVKSIKADLKRQGIEISAAETDAVASLLDKYGLTPGATNA